MKKRDLITVGFVAHHVEARPYIREQMEKHVITVLEEPSNPAFSRMLSGDLPLDEYLLEVDSESPAFDRLLCGVLRGAPRRGKGLEEEAHSEVHFRARRARFPGTFREGACLSPARSAVSSDRESKFALVSSLSSFRQDGTISWASSIRRASLMRVVLM